ncbi:hypothetical protein KKI24_27015, partial [bacterium]|nr:hypothetical protein [bacterium]
AVNDQIDLTNGYGFTIDGGGGSDTVYGGGSASALYIGSISNVETIIGSGHSDTLGGDGTSSSYIGGGGNDHIIGGAGNDTAYYGASFSDIIYQMKTGGYGFITTSGGATQVRTAQDGWDTLEQVENIRFADGAVINPYANTPPFAVSEVLPSVITPYFMNLPFGISKNSFLANDFDIDLGDSVTNLQVVGCSGATVGDGGSFLSFSPHNLIGSGTVTLTYRVIDSRGAYGEYATASFGYAATGTAPPLIFDLDGDGVEIDNTVNSGVLFDIDADGQKETMDAWAGSDDGFLAYDANGDGMVNDGVEIVFSGYHPDATTDLQGLALAFDSNADGIFDSNDETWEQFGIWQDADQDGLSDEGEFITLADAEIAAIDLKSAEQAYSVENGQVSGTGTYTRTDGSSHIFADAALGFTENRALPAEPSGEGAVVPEDTVVSDTGEYEKFLDQYETEMEAIQTSIAGADPINGESTDLVADLTIYDHVEIADAVASAHRAYHEETLLPEASHIQIDESQGPVDQFLEIHEFSEIWLTAPDPDFIC